MSAAANKRRRANLAAAKAKGSHTHMDWLTLQLALDGCLVCEAQDGITKDHIIPISRGGADDLENIQPLCHRCNSRKGAAFWGDLRPDYWRQAVADLNAYFEAQP